MRPSYVLIIPLLASPAYAGSRSGGSGGGALSQVSAGIGAASGGGSGRSASVDPPANWNEPEPECVRVRDGAPIECPVTTVRGRGVRAVHSNAATPAATLDFYAGAQKVHDSDGSVTIDVVVRDSRRFQLAGSFSHYFERLMSGGRLAMSMPSLRGGVRIDDLGATSVVLEVGAVHAATRGDPMADSSITGPIAGMRLAHAISPRTSVLVDVHGLWFPDDIRARSGRVGVRVGHLEASFRILDFNVGPALYGPEVGMAF